MRKEKSMGHLPMAALVLAASIASVFAAEGRAPVFAPGTVLVADGKYYVSRNIVNPGAGAAIVIAAPNVDLDLNGMHVSNPAGSGDPVIDIGAAVDHVTIKNGTLSGGAGCIIALGPNRLVEIEDVKCRDTAANGMTLFDVAMATVRRSEVTDTTAAGIVLNGGGGVASGTIADNLVRRTTFAGIVVANCSSVGVWHNRVEDLPSSDGMVIANCSGAIIAENTVDRVTGNGIYILEGRANKLLDNVVSRSAEHGIRIDRLTVDTLVLHNNSSGNGTAAAGFGDGILVEGNRNMIRDNILNGNSRYGLHFNAFGGAGLACENTFGGNTARGNTGPGPGCGGAPALFPPNSCNAAVGCALPNTTYGTNLIPGPPVF